MVHRVVDRQASKMGPEDLPVLMGPHEMVYRVVDT